MGLLLAALAAFIPLLIVPGLLFHYDSAPKVILLVLAMAAALMRPGRIAGEVTLLWRDRRGRWLCLIGGAQVLWSAVATAASVRPLFSLLGSNWRRMGLVTILALVAFAILSAAHLLRRPAHVKRILQATALAAVLVSLYTALQYFNIDPLQNRAGYRAQDGDFTIVRPPGTLGHADYLAWWLNIALFSSWGLARTERGFWRAAGLAAAALSAFAVLLSGTRSAAGALICGLMFLALISRFRPGFRHSMYASAAVAGLLVFYVSPAGQGLRSRVQWSSDEAIGGARPLLWRDSLQMAAARPLTGYGPETFSAEFPRFQSVDLARLVPDFYHESPHNAALDALASEGIPGLLIALGWAGVGVYSIVRLRGKGTPLENALSAAFVASLVTSLFNSLTLGPATASLTVLAMLIALRGQSPGELPALSRRSAFATAIPVAAILAIFGGWLTVSDFRLERFRNISSSPGGGAAAAYSGLRSSTLLGAAEDLYCSRRLANLCAAGNGVIARIECLRVATQAAARATATSDNPPNAWYNLAMFAAAQNDIRGTEKELRRAVLLAPNWYRPHWALANLLQRRGLHTDAMGEIERAALLDAGKDAEVADSLRRIEESR